MNDLTIMDTYFGCTRLKCPCIASYNGKMGEYCCTECLNGKPCERNIHKYPIMFYDYTMCNNPKCKSYKVGVKHCSHTCLQFK